LKDHFAAKRKLKIWRHLGICLAEWADRLFSSLD